MADGFGRDWLTPVSCGGAGAAGVGATGLGAVEDGAEGNDEANDGERGHDGEEDLGRLPHVAPPAHGCCSAARGPSLSGEWHCSGMYF